MPTVPTVPAVVLAVAPAMALARAIIGVLAVDVLPAVVGVGGDPSWGVAALRGRGIEWLVGHRALLTNSFDTPGGYPCIGHGYHPGVYEAIL
ncbi:unannotated protein [freshwater metagenome]|uniref:Unannotated protein n=1 Tax=freshwater metagenome TaxID=449393 RepID=A0A6J7INU6_9ZZZZ